MLLRLTIENILSYNSATTFSAMPTTSERLPNHIYQFEDFGILKNSVLFGPNGAGKTNLILALVFISGVMAEGNVGYFRPQMLPFKLIDADHPSSVTLEFESEGTGYSYNLTILEGIVYRERLAIINLSNNDQQLIFQREWDEIEIGGGGPFPIPDQSHALPEPHEPFLSFAKVGECDEINDAYKWITRHLQIHMPQLTHDNLAVDFINDEDFLIYMNETLKVLDIGIEEIGVKTVYLDTYYARTFTKERTALLRSIKKRGCVRLEKQRNAIAEMENGRPVVKILKSYHRNSSGDLVTMDLLDESNGALSVIDFLTVLYKVNFYPVTVVFDGLDRNIHPLILRELIGQLHMYPDKKGQLIFTAHATELLDLKLFREDEIWFAQKDCTGATELYPLSNYPVTTKVDIRKAYLSGRFGALPAY